MKIAFWSVDSRCGTTCNMLAVAAIFSLLYPKTRVVVKNGREAKEKEVRKQEDADFFFLDCGAGSYEKKCRILREMDLVIVNLKQEEEHLNRFFLENKHLLSNFYVVLGNYYRQSVYDPRYLEQVYRMCPEKCVVISNNSEFEQACSRRRIRRFIQAEYRQTKSLRNERLLSELTQLAHGILRSGQA
ncbi:MAG: hypothetical protein ACI4DR_02655 [Roseburia sp.]